MLGHQCELFYFLCTTAFYALPVLAIVEVFIRPSVRHTLALYQNDDT